MKRKLISLLLAITAVSLLLVSCGGSSVGDSEKTHPVQFALSDVTAKAGEIITVELTVTSTVEANAFALYPPEYDTDVLEFVEFANLGDAGKKSVFGELGLDQNKKTISLMLTQAEQLTGKVCEIRFKVKDNAKAGTTKISMQPVVKNNSADVEAGVTSCTVTIE